MLDRYIKVLQSTNGKFYKLKYQDRDMNFIKKIVNKKLDEAVHMQFQKFSRGEFKDRAVISAKQSGGKFTIFTTAEFGNELVKIVAEKVGSNKTKVTGAVVSTSDLKNELKFKEIKQFQGVKKYMIEDEMTGKDISNLVFKFPKAFFGLSFEAEKDETILKIKAKAPKSGKPGKNSEESKKPDFCKLITRDKELGESFVFENPNFKSAEISHDFIITELVFPKEEKDFAKIREMAKRKGKIIRKSKIDGVETKKEFDFEA